MGNPPQDQLSLFDDGQTSAPLLDDQRLNLLALSRVKGLGERSLKVLIHTYIDLNLVWDAAPAELSTTLGSIGLRNVKEVIDQIIGHRYELKEIAKRDLDNLHRQKIQLLMRQDSDFPQKLHDIEDSPQWLFVQGNIKGLSLSNLVAVVGTRDSSTQGEERTRILTRWLAEKGFGIVSGLAEGIDEVAHQTAIDYGALNIAVLGTGIQVVFPASTGHIRKRIVSDGGTIVTEYLPNESYSRLKFVRRNRIQAGLSYAVVPVEGKVNSGTAHTFRFAQQFKRIIFGVVKSGKPTEDGIITLLRKGNYPIYDLDSPTSMGELEILLKSALEGVVSTPNEKWPFEGLIREFDRIVSSYLITTDELDRLKAEMGKIWKRAKNGSQGGDT